MNPTDEIGINRRRGTLAPSGRSRNAQRQLRKKCVTASVPT